MKRGYKASLEPDMPCGKCCVGIYDELAATNEKAIALLAGGSIPKCKSANRLCVGALDLLAGSKVNELPRNPR